MEDAAPLNSGFDGRKRGKSVEECQDMIQRSFQNPTVKFLMEQMEKSGCRVGDNFIKAADCTDPTSYYHGGYVKGTGIIVCSNKMDTQDEVNQVLIHELIHAYDECRAKNLDWTNCAHHTCSEIRAGRLSGDCHFKREVFRGFIKSSGYAYEQECIKRRALKSLGGNPYCSEVAAKEALEAVWDTCYNDIKPFDSL